MVGQMHYIYVLQSNKDDNLYIGCTQNVEKRLELHNRGMVKSTKARRPFALIYSEKIEDKHEAFFKRVRSIRARCRRRSKRKPFIISVFDQARMDLFPKIYKVDGAAFGRIRTDSP